MTKNEHSRRRDGLAAVLTADGSLDVGEWRALGLRDGTARAAVPVDGGRASA